MHQFSYDLHACRSIIKQLVSSISKPTAKEYEYLTVTRELLQEGIYSSICIVLELYFFKRVCQNYYYMAGQQHICRPQQCARIRGSNNQDPDGCAAAFLHTVLPQYQFSDKTIGLRSSIGDCRTPYIEWTHMHGYGTILLWNIWTPSFVLYGCIWLGDKAKQDDHVSIFRNEMIRSRMWSRETGSSLFYVQLKDTRKWNRTLTVGLSSSVNFCFIPFLILILFPYSFSRSPH